MCQRWPNHDLTHIAISFIRHILIAVNCHQLYPFTPNALYAMLNICIHIPITAQHWMEVFELLHRLSVYHLILLASRCSSQVSRFLFGPYASHSRWQYHVHRAMCRSSARSSEARKSRQRFHLESCFLHPYVEIQDNSEILCHGLYASGWWNIWTIALRTFLLRVLMARYEISLSTSSHLMVAWSEGLDEGEKMGP